MGKEKKSETNYEDIQEIKWTKSEEKKRWDENEEVTSNEDCK